MATLPSHSHLQYQERQSRHSPQQKQHPSPQQQQRHSPHHQFFQNGSSPEFEGSSPTGERKHKGSSSPQHSEGGGRSHRDSENPEWGLTKAGKKRQRLPLACQVCRKKKVFYALLYNLSTLLTCTNRYDVQGSNPFASIAYGFHYHAYIKRLHQDGLETRLERNLVCQVAEEGSSQPSISKTSRPARHRHSNPQ